MVLATGDVSVGGVVVSRVYNTRSAAVADPMFGPGWVSSVIVTEGQSPFTKLDVFDSLIQVGLPDGSVIGFTATGDGTTFEPAESDGEIAITYNSATDKYTVSDKVGNTVVFGRKTGDPAGHYRPEQVTEASSGDKTTVSWEKVTIDGQDVLRPTRVLAAVPDGVSCVTLVRGCKALTFTYATSTSGDDFTGRVQQISYTAWDPAAPAMVTVALARYAYDAAGRLRASWDPRLDWNDEALHHLQTSYTYNGDGILSALTPPAQEGWQLTYTTLPGDSGKGRVHQVTRSALTAGTAVTTMVYRVPLAGAGAPYDLAPGQTARWAQNAAPTDATAIFPATQVPGGDPASGQLPASYERASLSYLDANARMVNTAQPGGHIDAVVYDAHGNVTMQVTAANRRWALDTEPADTAAHEAELVSDVASSQRVYTADGKRLTAEIGPSHEMRLASGTVINGRVRTEYTYDEGAPGTGGPFNLVTTETTSARWFDGGQERQADARATKHEYNWDLRQRTKTTMDPAGLALVSRTGYDTEGRIITETTPGGGSSDSTPSTSVTVYYTATAQIGNPQCGNKPDWDGLVCLTMSGGQAASGAELPATAYTYNMFGQPLTTSETTSSATLRTVTLTYDQAGRTIEVKVVAPGLGEPVATRRTVYDEATGHNVKTQVIDGAGAVTAEIVREFDALGQSTSYRDADGNNSTSTYDLLGRPLTSNDGKATRSYGYDEGSERRGLATSVVDSNVGKFTGTYDADGRLIGQRWPNGVTVDLTVNSTGTATGLIYAQPGCGQADCTLYQETIKPGPQGQWQARTSTLSSQDYGHDQAGRLTQVADTADGQCVTRSYTYDAAFNRTGQTSYGPGTGGTCQTTTASTTTGWTFDTASRAVSTGYSYDALGRTLTMPSADTATGVGNVTIGYHGNDMVHSITQGSHATVYTLDVVDSRIRSWTDNKTGTLVGKTNHYTDDGDSPTWTDEGDGKFTRPIAGLGGIAAQHTATVGEVWTLTNMHGDFVAAMGEIGAGLASTGEYTENGQPRDSADAGKRYGWHGADQRAADTPGGLLLMGVRLYTPTTGRFLQVDPVINGSCNPYEYACGDPVNNSDLTGEAAEGGGGGGKKPDCVLLKCSTWTWWAKAISIVTNVLGFAPGWMCPACAIISLALGAIAGILYWLGGNKKEAFRTWAWALAGFVMGKFAEKALPKIFRHYGKQIKHTVRATMMRAKRVVPSKLYKKADNIVSGVLGLFGLILDAIGG